MVRSPVNEVIGSINYDTVQIFLVSFFLVIWSLALPGGFLVGDVKPEEVDGFVISRTPVGYKMISSAAVVAGSYSIFAFNVRYPIIRFYSFLNAIGITLSFFGDLTLQNLFYHGNDTYVLLAAMVIFGIGYSCYSLASLLILISSFDKSRHRIWKFLIWPLISIAMAVITTVTLLLAALLPLSIYKSAPLLKIVATCFYMCVICTTLATGLSILRVNSCFMFHAAGVFLIFSSDIVLSFRAIAGYNFPFIEDVVWLSYGFGQVLVNFGFFFEMILRRNGFYDLTSFVKTKFKMYVENFARTYKDGEIEV